MSAPANTQVLPFESVVSEAAAAIREATSKADTSKQESFCIRLWCEWIKSEVLA